MRLDETNTMKPSPTFYLFSIKCYCKKKTGRSCLFSMSIVLFFVATANTDSSGKRPSFLWSTGKRLHVPFRKYILNISTKIYFRGYSRATFLKKFSPNG